jgi:NADH dehydrogenase
MQHGRYIARTILRDLKGLPREPFRFVDKGQMATIGRSKAVLEIGSLKMAGWPAWVAWLIVHIYYLTGFENRFLVVLQWAWSYLTFSRGARLIVGKEWRTKQ